MTAGIVRWLAGLRVRITVLVVGSLLLSAFGFYGLLDFLARDWARRELTDQSLAMVERLAKDATTPLLLGDTGDLEELVARESGDADVVGSSILRPDGSEMVSRINDSRLWSALPAGAQGLHRRRTTTTHEHRMGIDVYTMLAPVQRRAGGPAPLVDEMLGLPTTPEGGAARTELVGWVRIAYSTARLEGDLATARQIGLVFLLVVIGIGLVASLLMLRLVVQPLREASDLAREIADGNLARRLPVRAGDELGALAESMNSMATTLVESREREHAEAAALRETAEAVVAIAQGARAARDPASVFQVVAQQLRRITKCECVALAVPEPQGRRLLFSHFDPPPPWGGVFRGAELDASLAGALSGVDPPPLRLQTAAHHIPLATALADRGFGAALFVPLALEGGPPAALMLVARDASAFRPAELRIAGGLASHLAAALHAGQLHSKLETAFDELHHTREQLVRSERLRVAGDMASGIAHEFNNVLAAILGRVQLLRLRSKDGTLSPPELEQAFGVMELAARDGAETVRRLRQFGKGEGTDSAEPVDLDNVMREAAEFTRPRWKNTAQGGGVHIEMKLDLAAGAWVRGNASQLREVFTNLILNAVDAMPNGGTIRLASVERNATVTAMVEDDGTGMTPETVQRVFEPFFTTKGVQGTGLGLSMVYGIVQRHGGKLNVYSAPGRGTRIEVAFPSCAPALPSAEPEAPSVSQGLSVMVVDDEPAVRALLVDILKALGHQVVGHGGGESALAEFEPGRFDLVLTDLGMPGMNGWQLCQALRARDPHVTIVFVTGWGEDVESAQVQDAGADTVVAKPFGLEDLARVAQMAADRTRRRAA